MNIYLAPLQGYTNADYRKLFNKYFGGVDKYFSPYLRFEPNKELKKSVLKDIHPENNEGINFVPQVLGADIPMFIDIASQLDRWGYKELNWNLGCPYAMVTKRGLGSALIQQPEKLREILESVLGQINIPLSIKCRLGFESDEEIFPLIEVLNDFPIKELTVHARTAKQMYKGEANPDAFVSLINKTEHKLVYNGDIATVYDIEEHRAQFNNTIDTFMIGRGLLGDPFLASEIKGNEFTKAEKKTIIKEFHNELFEVNNQKLHSTHLLNRMVAHWEYFSCLFENQHKTYKQIKKAKTIDRFTRVVNAIIDEYC